MRIIAKKTLHDFWQLARRCGGAAEGLVRPGKAESNGDHLPDVQALYPSASIVGKDRVVFRLKGGAYRLIVKVWSTRDGKSTYVS